MYYSKSCEVNYLCPSRYYTKAKKVLLQYQHMPSFQGINEDCAVIVTELQLKLREHFKDKEVT